MPEYTYLCNDCNEKFTKVFNIKDYQETTNCCFCKSKKTCRMYQDDLLSCSGFVKKSDSELKTVGDIANRNRDKLSKDQKVDIDKKNNKYKDNEGKELPKGMSRMKKSNVKYKWRE